MEAAPNEFLHPSRALPLGRPHALLSRVAPSRSSLPVSACLLAWGPVCLCTSSCLLACVPASAFAPACLSLPACLCTCPCLPAVPTVRAERGSVRASGGQARAGWGAGHSRWASVTVTPESSFSAAAHSRAHPAPAGLAPAGTQCPGAVPFFLWPHASGVPTRVSAKEAPGKEAPLAWPAQAFSAGVAVCRGVCCGRSAGAHAVPSQGEDGVCRLLLFLCRDWSATQGHSASHAMVLPLQGSGGGGTIRVR